MSFSCPTGAPISALLSVHLSSRTKSTLREVNEKRLDLGTPMKQLAWGNNEQRKRN